MANATTGRAAARDDQRTPAQWYCLLAGVALLLAGVADRAAGTRFQPESATTRRERARR
jgi:hypothetical protein